MSSRRMLSIAVFAAVAVAVPVAAAAPSTAAPAPTPSVSGYVGSPQEVANNKAFYNAVMKSAEAKRAKLGNKTAAVTVVYSTSRAPSFRTQIARSAQIWNNATNNVTLAEGSNYDFYYREGNDSRGSFASTDGHGSGYIFLDYQQNQQYNSTRVTAHETGHVLGLPDHYSGPCSELMSGGGPGTSCTNPYPNRTEASRVDQLWANGLN
ncbi:snapalysin [Kribbella monticola]|uniref:snapalysin n=1 Tax=Kribbella monticola TaxID=2185285 RepID=UPI000DD2C812|nr:snapalysin [Kribbella monticola]